MFSIRFAHGAVGDLKGLSGHVRARILEAIERSLRAQPQTSSRNRKELVGLVPPREHVLPVWELRVGDYRVFYDVETASRQVIVRAVRRKGRSSTEEIL
jgi:mRNA-degrading endonuclease RelE of RelBE toxin-antitoxin system